MNDTNVNSIEIEEFLFGGEIWPGNDPYRSTVMEGFDCLTKSNEYTEVFSTFETFKETDKIFCEDMGWNEEMMQVVDIHEATQTFDISDMDDKELLYYYNLFLTKEKIDDEG